MIMAMMLLLIGAAASMRMTSSAAASPLSMHGGARGPESLSDVGYEPEGLGLPANVLHPPMGWNSWNHYHCAVDEAILRNISQLYKTTGVAAAGYRYVNIDDLFWARFFTHTRNCSCSFI